MCGLCNEPPLSIARSGAYFWIAVAVKLLLPTMPFPALEISAKCPANVQPELSHRLPKSMSLVEAVAMRSAVTRQSLIEAWWLVHEGQAITKSLADQTQTSILHSVAQPWLCTITTDPYVIYSSRVF